MKPSPPSRPRNPRSDPERSTASWTLPEPGDVLSYSYLWADEAAAGQEEGLKDRPTVVVVAQLVQDTHRQLLVAPITHSNPAPGTGLEIPSSVKKHLGLDDERSWIMVTELNRFVWPGPDIRPVPGKETPLYGSIPARLFHRMRDAIVAYNRSDDLKVVKRSE